MKIHQINDIQRDDQNIVGNPWPRLDTIRLFHLAELNINVDRFLTAITPTFSQLPWDEYDVRRQRIRILKESLGESEQDFARWVELYYAGEVPITALDHWLARLPKETNDLVRNTEPFRRRAVASFDLACTVGGGWVVRRRPSELFKMGVPDYRSTARLFAEIPEIVAEHPDLRTLLLVIAEMVCSTGVPARAMRVTVHMISCVARADRSTTNSPEGIHQDGASFIVSALVVSRIAVQGGMSTVYGPDQRTPIICICLAPGQGLFHADTGSGLWHDVSPIFVVGDAAEGIRNILGFDIHLVD